MYFLDTEFHECQINGIDTIQMISLGLVRENGEEFYKIVNDFDVDLAMQNEWLKDHVLLPIFKELKERNVISEANVESFKNDFSYTKEDLKRDLLSFIGEDEPEFWAYYADYDWVNLCWLFGRMMDLPSNFPMWCQDLMQLLDGVNPHYLVKQDTNKEHNALEDAKWNKAVYEVYKKVYIDEK